MSVGSNGNINTGSGSNELMSFTATGTTCLSSGIRTLNIDLCNARFAYVSVSYRSRRGTRGFSRVGGRVLTSFVACTRASVDKGNARLFIGTGGPRNCGRYSGCNVIRICSRAEFVIAANGVMSNRSAFVTYYRRRLGSLYRGRLVGVRITGNIMNTKRCRGSARLVLRGLGSIREKGRFLRNG